MYVAPSDRPHVSVRIDDAPELSGIGEADGVEPAAVHVDRVMMQAHHGVCARIRQGAIEPSSSCARQAAADMARVVAVEHDELPAARGVRAADLKRRSARARGASPRAHRDCPECTAPAFADCRTCSRKRRYPDGSSCTRSPVTSTAAIVRHLCERLVEHAAQARSRSPRRAACRRRCRTGEDR